MAIEDKIRELAASYASELKSKMTARIEEMKEDDKSHFLIYQVLGVTDDEGELIDVYQNKGRFLYKYAGSFLEEATSLCFRETHPQASRKRIENTIGKRPKEFEIDCLIDTDAIEIKWRDATTDGDHITKEHTRIQAIKAYGFTPIRVMFYYPNRDQAIRIQEALKAIYQSVGGEYYTGDEAWDYILARTGVDLKQILIGIAKENKKAHR
ncbi:MAG: ApaLI family restriction endonuclease [Anaerolineales bacterium]|nr:ApaLI family restriction endonuclease [Anaerolineales bacterium]